MLRNKITYITLSGIFLMACALVSCNSQGGQDNPVPKTNQEQAAAAPDKACGKTFLFEMSNQAGISKGYGEIWNDSAKLHVSFAPGSGQTFASATAKYLLPDGKSITFPPMRPAGEGFMYTSLPLDQTLDCAKIQLQVQVAAVGGSTTEEAKPNAGGAIDDKGEVRYCIQKCTATTCDGPEPNKTHTTYTHAQWFQEGSTANNIARKLFARRDAQAIHLGCSKQTEIRSIEDMQAWAKDNLHLTKGDLSMEIGALALSIYCDQSDPSFSPSDFPLSELVVSSGDFQGWSTEDLLTEAQGVLGGCLSNYSEVQMNLVLRDINAWCMPNKPQVLACP